MSDLIDDANDAADMFLKSALHKRKKNAKEIPIDGIGVCLNCGQDVTGTRRWCDAACRDTWEENYDKT